MKKTVRLFNIDQKTYLVSADPIKVGDNAVVTVGGEFPSVVKCENEQVLNLIIDSKLSLTKAFKIVALPEQLDITDQEMAIIEQNQWFCQIDEEESEDEVKKDWGVSFAPTKKVKIIVE
jgi:hypothetical protein